MATSSSALVSTTRADGKGATTTTTTTTTKLSVGRACAIIGVSALVGGAVSSVYWGSTPLALGGERTARRSKIASLGEGAGPIFDPKMFVDEKHAEEFAARQKAKLRTRVSVLVNEFSDEDKRAGKITAGTVVSKYMKFRNMNEQGIANYVRFERAVVPLYWPKTLDLALEAVEVFKLNETNQAAWIGVANKVEKTASQVVPEAWSHYPMHHHLGCLYSHLRLWDGVKRNNLPNMVVLESDAIWRTSVDVLDYQNIIDNAPKDFDMIFLKDMRKCPGHFVKQFKSTAIGQNITMPDVRRGSPNMIYMYKMNKKCGFAGFESYIISSKGVDKIRDFVAKRGGMDMVDAFVGNYLCKVKRPNHVIDCYTASTIKIEREEMGGYLPDWYGDERIEKSVDANLLERFDNDYSAFNLAACERPENKYTGFIPVAYTEQEPDTVFACATDKVSKSLNVCDASMGLPLVPSRGGARPRELAGKNAAS